MHFKIFKKSNGLVWVKPTKELTDNKIVFRTFQRAKNQAIRLIQAEIYKHRNNIVALRKIKKNEVD